MIQAPVAPTAIAPRHSRVIQPKKPDAILRAPDASRLFCFSCMSMKALMLASQSTKAGAAPCDSSAAASCAWPAACSAITRSISGLVRRSCSLIASSAAFSAGRISFSSPNSLSIGSAERV